MSIAQHHETRLTDFLKELKQKDSYALISDAVDVDTAVIFVHGFLGSPEGTWLNFQDAIFSQRNPNYLRWSKCDVYFFSYRSFRDDITESAQALLKFIKAVFPEPPDSIFKIPQRVAGVRSLLDVTKGKPTYRELVLVGHSEGGIVIRRAVDIAYGREITAGGPAIDFDYARGATNVLMARLALFAPAIKGVKLSGWFGACLSVARVDAIVMPFLNFSPAFVEMKQGGLLDELKDHAETYRSELKAERKIAPAALRAHIVFGSEDHVVQKSFLVGDCLHDSEEGKDHVTICKPKPGYDRPAKIVLRRIEGEEKCTDLSNS
jgi:pimeloyl-ACP methyl ester carboxylesterase